MLFAFLKVLRVVWVLVERVTWSRYRGVAMSFFLILYSTFSLCMARLALSVSYPTSLSKSFVGDLRRAPVTSRAILSCVRSSRMASVTVRLES